MEHDYFIMAFRGAVIVYTKIKPADNCPKLNLRKIKTYMYEMLFDYHNNILNLRKIKMYMYKMLFDYHNILNLRKMMTYIYEMLFDYHNIYHTTVLSHTCLNSVVTLALIP